MPNVNELLAIAIEETHQLHKGEEFLFEIYSRDTSGTGFPEVTDCCSGLFS